MGLSLDRNLPSFEPVKQEKLYYVTSENLKSSFLFPPTYPNVTAGVDAVLSYADILVCLLLSQEVPPVEVSLEKVSARSSEDKGRTIFLT